MADCDNSGFHLDLTDIESPENDRIFRNMKYERIIKLIAEKQSISLEEAMNMPYSSPLFEIIYDGTDDWICRNDIYLADGIMRMNQSTL